MMELDLFNLDRLPMKENTYNRKRSSSSSTSFGKQSIDKSYESESNVVFNAMAPNSSVSQFNLGSIPDN